MCCPLQLARERGSDEATNRMMAVEGSGGARARRSAPS